MSRFTERYSGVICYYAVNEHMGVAMSEEKIRSRIETSLAKGRLPGVFDLPKVLSLKKKLEHCDSADEVVVLLEQNKLAIMKIFRLPESEIISCIEDIKAIG